MEFTNLVGELEIIMNPAEADERNIYIENNTSMVVYDIITDGTPVFVSAFNAKKEKIVSGETPTVPDSETSSPDFSPTSSSLFNQTVIAPTFLRFKTLIGGNVKIRLRAIY